ncbi:glutathione S-transferase U8-like [Punica granatum]|uniref:glutathione transferase n=1 Tax=Punica granatum TaxID=22663 RepID=A0A218W2T8_PUNGR|nr:glutathione S-transferase U8-like [Punica granatum]OWM67157.1 hypothetical protein CDL15_Pgr000609 [Punica granatum]
MANKEVKLYGAWGSPFSSRVEIALKLKGVPYQFFDEDLTNKSPDLLRYNPVHKKIPVLVHRGKPIAESLVILEYIDETWKSAYPLLPEDPYDRAMARFWSRFLDEQCLLASWKAASSEGEARAKLKEEAHGHLKTLEEQLKRKKFFGGDSVGFLDISANFVAHWLVIIQEAAGVDLFTEDKFPTLWKWAEEFRCCPIIKDNLPEKERLSAHFKARFGGQNASK